MKDSVLVIILGTSHSNDYGLIRSLSKAHISLVFIMIGESDPYYLAKSRYLKHNEICKVSSFAEAYQVINSYRGRREKKVIICTNDRAAKFVDANESKLCDDFVTPMRGGRIGALFNKEEQCKLASTCGLKVPESIVYQVGNKLDEKELHYPLLTKPLDSSMGSKSDIHICRTPSELKQAIQREGACQSFIIQEYIEKDFEINALGTRTEKGVIWGGAIKKIRHYPPIVGSATYAKIYPVHDFGINTHGVEEFLESIGYFGLFSVEFLQKGKDNYFMEVNMRNDGLCYASTCINRNLPAMYIFPESAMNANIFKPIFMMNLLLDLRLFLNHPQNLLYWLKDFCNTKCFLDFDVRDLVPFVKYILNSIIKR